VIPIKLLLSNINYENNINEPWNKKMINNVMIYCLLLRLINPKEIVISSIQRGEIHLDVMLIQKLRAC
ncbi:unnamed protein product, partial [Musa acuminata subsp. burmannicoides]